MTRAMHWYLMWQSVILSLLVLSIFFGYRASLQLSKLRHDVKLVRSLIMVWATTWGQTPDTVAVALSKCLETLTEQPRPRWYRRIRVVNNG